MLSLELISKRDDIEKAQEALNVRARRLGFTKAIDLERIVLEDGTYKYTAMAV